MQRLTFRSIIRPLVGCFAFFCITTVVYAHGTKTGDLVIDHPYATPSLSGVPNGAAYLRGIENTGSTADKLLGASTEVAERVELHRMTMDGNIMRMREVPNIELPAKTVVKLRHNGEYHLMLMNLKRPLKDGDRFDITLEFQRAGKQTVNVWVQIPRDGSTEHKH
ncbi:MAG: copper chaperone PCu(A)C [Rhodoferax sp.]|nr:MAG: copper chaperone PCu(A)C [Rhodoferax sp.]